MINNINCNNSILDDTCMNNLDKNNQLIKLLDEINYLTYQKKSYAMAISYLTLIHLFVFFIIISRTIDLFYGRYVVMIEGSLLFIIIFAAMRFEYFRKRGDVLFEEISDELAWNLTNKVSKEEVSKERPSLKIRVILRSFVKTSDLPIVPGKYGPLSYIIANCLITWFGIFFGKGL